MHMYLCAPWMQQPLKGQLMKVKSVSLSIGLKSNSIANRVLCHAFSVRLNIDEQMSVEFSHMLPSCLPSQWYLL